MAQLRAAVQQARDEVAEARRLDGIDRSQLIAAQRRLLGVLDTYIRVLDAAGLAPHRQLRIEVDLLRGITEPVASRRVPVAMGRTTSPGQTY